MHTNVVEYLYNNFQPFHTEWISVENCLVNRDWDNVETIVKKKIKEGLCERDIEKMINHAHMSLLLKALDCSNNKKLREIISILFISVTSYRLMRRFPDKKFNFEKIEDSNELTVIYYHI
jgi:hypothetical protein